LPNKQKILDTTLQYNENGSVAGLNVGEGLYIADGELRAYTFILFWGGIEGNLADQTDLGAAMRILFNCPCSMAWPCRYVLPA
jgi:hypothetical protein